MADAVSKSPPKTQIDKEDANTSKYLSHFLYKATLVTVFVVLLPLFPSLAPDFINQTLHGRSWELVQLIFVGIAVSYGLFSKKNDGQHEEIDANAQSYVSKLLQVSSVFEEECDSTATNSVIEENKFELLNSQYYRGEPPVVVEKSMNMNRPKPLLLPVRSLKPADHESATTTTTTTTINSNSRHEKLEEENVVLRSPIPWRSRSGRMEVKEDGDESNMSPASAKGQKKRSPCLCSDDDESQPKFSQDHVVVRRKHLSSPPPPPFIPTSVLTKSNSSVFNNNNTHHDSPDKVLKRSVTSVPHSDTKMDQNSRSELRGRIQNETGLNMKSVSTIFRPSELAMGADHKQFLKQEKNGLVEKFLVETSDEDEEEEESGNDGEAAAAADSSSFNDVGGPDVDKKADEFIAKFREQIRLQRIESIRRSTAQRAGNTLRT